jgi:hypothetical protein
MPGLPLFVRWRQLKISRSLFIAARAGKTSMPSRYSAILRPVMFQHNLGRLASLQG